MIESPINNLVSVVIPVFNREAAVEATMRSVHESSYRPIELVLVNDGSTDKSQSKLLGFQETFQDELFQIIVHVQENQGGSAARNKGMDLSHGEYIQFLDSDDFIDRDKLTVQVSEMKKSGCDLCVSDFQKDYPGQEKSSIRIVNSRSRYRILRGGSPGCASPLMMRELATATRWTENLKNLQDVDYFLKVFILSRKISHIPRVLYYYQMHLGPGITRDSRAIKRPVPYKTRMSSLLNDCILGNNYGTVINRYGYGLYAYAVLFCKKLKYDCRIWWQR